MVITLALAVVLSQSGPAPDDQISSHVLTNIRRALRISSSVALVTVRSAVGENRIMLDVNEAVVGTFPAELEVTVRAFNKQDVAPGTVLLVFFRGSVTARVPTGHYELANDGKIREYPLQTYLARTRFEGARVVKPKAEPKPAPVAPSTAPLSAAGPVSPAGS